MATLEIQKVGQVQEKSGNHGPFYQVALMGLLDGKFDQVAFFTPKKENIPKAGDTLQGIVTENQYGKMFKKNRETSSLMRREDPEVRAEIMRQNALTNAVHFIEVRATLLSKYEASDLLSLEFTTTDNVILVAQKFFAFNAGKLPVSTSESPDDEKTIAEGGSGGV